MSNIYEMWLFVIYILYFWNEKKLLLQSKSSKIPIVAYDEMLDFMWKFFCKLSGFLFFFMHNKYEANLTQNKFLQEDSLFENLNAADG